MRYHLCIIAGVFGLLPLGGGVQECSAQGGVRAGTTPAMPRVYTPTRTRSLRIKFPWRKRITTTVFWVGEKPTPRNPTPNSASSWDPSWQKNFGGYDDPSPDQRAWDFRPKGFLPKLNPFYVALPFNDVVNHDTARRVIPWFRLAPKARRTKSVCQGQWIAIRTGRKICYAQWEDCGPFVTDDWAYVFGFTPPKNRENGGAGLDVSPSVRDYLGIRSGVKCDWRFVDLSEIPPGPWRKYGSNNPFVRAAAAKAKKSEKSLEEMKRARDEWLKNSR
jgi:hypothetical protein